MYSPLARALILGTGVACITRVARAQCPDGMLPPCRTAAAAAPRGPVDANLIAIFPFRITGTSSDAAALREGAMDLLALALDEQAGLRVVPSRTLLARARNFTDASPVSEAAAVARTLGAGTMILGSAVVAGTQLRARAELYDVVRNRSTTSFEAHGTPGDPAPVIDSLAALLARARLAGAATSHRSLQEYASTSPAALKAFLRGEQLGRQGLWREAADSLLAATRLDSTFGLAYYRLSVAARYGAGLATWPPIEKALQFEDRLPRRQRELLRSVAATQHGVLRDELAAADAVATAYPDDPEVAFEQGEAYFHGAFALGGSPAPAARAYARSIALDSELIEPYNHLAELLFLAGDTAGAWRLTQRSLAMAPTASVQLGMMYALRAIRGESPAAITSGTTPPLPVLTRTEVSLERMLTNDPARATTLAAAFWTLIGAEAPAQERESARASRAFMLMVRGRLRDAAELLRADGEGTGLQVEQARMLLASRAGRAAAPGPGLLASTAMASVAGLAWNAYLTGDSAAVLSGIARLRQMPAPQAEHGRALADGLEGLMLLRRGDSVQAGAKLAGIMGVKAFSSDPRELVSTLFIALARLEFATGQVEAALRHLGAVNSIDGPTPYRGDAEELRGQIAERLGDTVTATRAWRNVVALWEGADPEFQPRVTAARAALARLEHR